MFNSGERLLGVAMISGRAIVVAVLSCVLAASSAFAAQFDESLDFVTFSEVAGAFRKHCVRVSIHGRTYRGKAPETEEFAVDIANERPTLVGGYWWDDRHVVIEDPGLQDHFIRSIEIGLPFSDLRFPARVAGRFVKLQAILLEVLPGDNDSLPQAFPLEFVDGDIDEAVVLTYLWDAGEWRIQANPGLGASAVTDSGTETVEFSHNGVFVTDEGLALGFAFGDKAILDPEQDYWCGRELPYTPLFGVEDGKRATAALRDKLDDAVVEVRFRLRVKVEEDDDDVDLSFAIDDEAPDDPSEVRAAGLVVGDRHLFVPLPLTAEGIARIEEIAVRTRSGDEIQASFVGAFRDYLAVLVESEEDLSAVSPPAGFAMLNPLLMPEEVFEPAGDRRARPEMEYFQRWRIDYFLGRRRETVDGDRWLGTFRSFRGDTVVLTRTNEGDGALAFDVEGRLAAVSLTPRVQSAGFERDESRRMATTGFRPLDHLYRMFHSQEVFDPALAPVDEERGRRLIDFGVEYQKLDANTARLFFAAEATRGGQIGLLVTHVYPGSTADAIGIREHDVLLRVFLEGRSEPSELRAGGGAGVNLFEMDDLSTASMQEMMAFLPPPWPSRDDALSGLLTAAGVGRKASIEYIREGDMVRTDFVTAYTDPDYRNARREKFAHLGLTVKPVTYEVARFFRRVDSSGVIVSKVEEGGKSSVAGLHKYLLITHVDGHRVEGMDDFAKRVRRFEDGERTAVELTVDGFGKTRLVKIE